MAPSCWFFRSWLCLTMMLAVGAAQEQGEGFLAQRCGNLTISSPFWLIETQAQRPCDSSDFETSCVHNTLVLKISIPFSFGFAIMDVSYEEDSMHVVDLGNVFLLQAPNSCGVPILNTSEKLGIEFSIDPSSPSLIIYNCTEAARGDKALVETRMGCGNKSSVFVRAGGRYDAASNYASYAMEGCNATILTVLGTSGRGGARI